jgi:hypothetical protein
MLMMHCEAGVCVLLFHTHFSMLNTLREIETAGAAGSFWPRDCKLKVNTQLKVRNGKLNFSFAGARTGCESSS